MKYSALAGGQRIEIELNALADDQVEARIEDRRYVVTVYEIQPGQYWFSWKNRSLDIAVVPTGQEYTVSFPGRAVSVEILDPPAAFRRAAHHGRDGIAEIRAPMPGKIVKVLVTEGAEVEPNQGLLVMEAMKMQNEIKSPKKGLVLKLGAAEGAAVNSGELLVVVE
jgi:biotin carboxyl carrier protein